MSDTHYRKVMGPVRKKTTPTQNPNPTPTWITCNHCSEPFISIQDVQGAVVRARDPNTSYYVADKVPSTFRPYPDEEVISEEIRAADQENNLADQLPILFDPSLGITTFEANGAPSVVTNLALAPILCFKCIKPAGWEVLEQSQSHPTVNAGQFLLPVPPALLPQKLFKWG